MNQETSWHSYPSIYALGHRALEPIVKLPLIVEEKIDGSQFSFGRFDGVLKVRSKGKEMFTDAPEKMFQAAVDAVSHLDLQDGWTYRGEYLSKPKHNVLKYDRIPEKHVIIFDINDGHESYLLPLEKHQETERIGLECVPCFHRGIVDGATLQTLLETDSVLGGTKIEGVVLKQYEVFGQDKKVLMGKYVSEAFKESHSKEWKASNPSQHDIVTRIIDTLRTDARWEKTIQHLRDSGDIECDPRDIGKLLKEISLDVRTEEAEWIRDQLFAWAWPHIARGVTRGFPDYYKASIAKEQLEVA